LTPDKINQRILNNSSFIQINTSQESELPSERSPAPFHGPESPTTDIIEYPLITGEQYQSENRLSSSTNSFLAIEEIPAQDPLNSDEYLPSPIESDDDRETILITNLADLQDEDDLSNLYDPVPLFSDQSQDDISNTKDPTLSQLINEILSSEEYQSI